MRHQPLLSTIFLTAALGCGDKEPFSPGNTTDADGDGFSGSDDCDDNDAAVNPDSRTSTKRPRKGMELKGFILQNIVFIDVRLCKTIVIEDKCFYNLWKLSRDDSGTIQDVFKVDYGESGVVLSSRGLGRI